jgi:hypothetical protein
MLNSITKLTFQVHIPNPVFPFPSLKVFFFFQSAAPAVVCALVNLIGTVAWDRKTPDTTIMLSIIANNALPKLYAISAMWTLNSRKRIRHAHSGSSNGRISTSEPHHTNDIELSAAWVSSDGSAVINVPKKTKKTQRAEPVFSLKRCTCVQQ